MTGDVLLLLTFYGDVLLLLIFVRCRIVWVPNTQCPKNTLDFREYGGASLWGNFPSILGEKNDASFPRITGKIPLEGTSSLCVL